MYLSIMFLTSSRIHGGGLYMGGATDKRYNLSFIVENGVKIGRPFIGVSVAYRLSAWGFLQSQEVSGSGNTNMGLRDQRLALHWINENINVRNTAMRWDAFADYSA